MNKERSESPFRQLIEQMLLVIEEDLRRVETDSRMRVIAEGAIARFCRVLTAIDISLLTPDESTGILERLRDLRARIPHKSKHLIGHFNQVINRLSDETSSHSK